MKDTTPKPKARAKVAHTYGAKDITRWKFEKNQLPEPWASHLGTLPKRFIMYIDGDGGHGKTEYQMQMAAVLIQYFGKVRLNNVEQGKHVQIQESVKRNKLDEAKAGKFAYCSIADFDTYVDQLKRPNSGRVQMIDSISYFPLTTEQVQKLIKLFPNKSFVFVAYLAHYNQYRPVRHLCDIKIRVQDFVAVNSGANRFGGTESYVIWNKPKKAKPSNGQLPLIPESVGEMLNSNGSNV